jgi:hypothetical protein
MHLWKLVFPVEDNGIMSDQQEQELVLGAAEVELLNRVGAYLVDCNGGDSISVDWMQGHKCWNIRALGTKGAQSSRTSPFIGAGPGLGDALEELATCQKKGGYTGLERVVPYFTGDKPAEQPELDAGGELTKDSGEAFVDMCVGALGLAKQAVLVGPDGFREPLLGDGDEEGSEMDREQLAVQPPEGVPPDYVNPPADGSAVDLQTGVYSPVIGGVALLQSFMAECPGVGDGGPAYFLRGWSEAGGYDESGDHSGWCSVGDIWVSSESLPPTTPKELASASKKD